jgi:5'(3')-deoxyribonucleotidase
MRNYSLPEDLLDQIKELIEKHKVYMTTAKDIRVYNDLELKLKYLKENNCKCS